MKGASTARCDITQIHQSVFVSVELFVCHFVLQCVSVCTYSSEVLQGDIIQIQQRGFHSGRHISEGWDLDLGAKYHILTLLEELYLT